MRSQYTHFVFRNTGDFRYQCGVEPFGQHVAGELAFFVLATLFTSFLTTLFESLFTTLLTALFKAAAFP